MGFELAAIAGCPFAENGGSIEVVDPMRTTIVTDEFDLEYLTHSCTCLDTFDCCGFVPEVLASGDFRWDFRWHAPERGTGTVAFQIAFNTADGDGSPNGDTISIYEVWLEEEPCPPRIEDLRVRKTACDPLAPGEQRVEFYREGGGPMDFQRETEGWPGIEQPAWTWTTPPETCRPLLDGRSLVAFSVAPTCDLGGEGLH